MASFNFKLVFLFILVSFVRFATTKAEDLHYSGGGCSGKRTTPNSPFQLNLRTLLKYLSSNATIDKKEFYNTTVFGRNQSDTVYGLFMCRGDIPSQLCGQCVSNATQLFMSPNQLFPDDDCSLSMEADSSYDECMFRYSNNNSQISTVDLSGASSCGNNKASSSFKRLLLDTMNKVADEAASSPIFSKKYATKQVRISGFHTLYSLAQCTPNLSSQDCRRCLKSIVAGIQQSCHGNEGNIQSLSCSIWYNSYPFYRPSQSPAPTALVPAANLPNTDSRYSQDLSGYLSHNCSSNVTVTPNRAFLSNLGTLLSYLSSNATIKTGFYKTSVDGLDHSDTVYGLFMCRNDVSPSHCQLCVQNATERISSECGSSKEAIIWYSHCLLRYSYRSFLSIGNETSPSFHELNISNTSSNLNQLQQSFFTWTLANTLSDAKTAIGKGTTKNYGTVSAKLNGNQTLYALAQCTPDLESGDCSTCLQNIFTEEIPWCCLASPEGKVMYPSCYMMFGLSKFYGDGDEADAVTHANPPQENSGEVPNINHNISILNYQRYRYIVLIN